MSLASSPTAGFERSKQTRKRLESCWGLDLAWTMSYPKFLKEVRLLNVYRYISIYMMFRAANKSENP